MRRSLTSPMFSTLVALAAAASPLAAAEAPKAAPVAARAPAPAAPAPAPTGHLSFEQAIDLAVSASPERAAAEAEPVGAAAKRRQAIAEFGPKVRADGSDIRFDKTVAIPFGPEVFTIRPDSMREGNLTVMQPLTGLFVAADRAGYAGLQKNAAELAVEKARSDAAFAAAEAYLRAQQADELVKIAQASIAATESQARDAEHLESNGRLIRSDLLKLNIASQDARAQMAKAVAAKKKAHERLRYELGLPPGQDPSLDPITATPDTVKKFVVPNADGATDQALKTRTEVKQAAIGVQKASYAQSLTRWKFAPNVDAFAKWNRIYSEPPFGNPPFTRSYGITATWDIWDNGSKVYESQAAAAERDKAEIMQKEAGDRLRVEIEALLADLAAAKESLSAAEASVTAAEEAYRLDKARFGSGLVTTTDLLLSETSQTKARGALVTAVTDYDVLILGLNKAMGEARPK